MSYIDLLFWFNDGVRFLQEFYFLCTLANYKKGIVKLLGTFKE